jgi:uncharacterized protein
MQIGTYHDLTILRFTSVGAFLGNETGEEVLLPNKYLTPEMEVGQLVHVFVYKDQQERPVATTIRPLAQLGEFAYFKVSWIDKAGAFLDWGLEKDLFVPFPEQKVNLQEGNEYLLHVRHDPETDRLYGTTKFGDALSQNTEGLNRNDQVELLVCDATELGLKVIVNNKYQGLIFNNHIIRPLMKGEKTKGYIKTIREDGKLDISLEKNSLEKFDDHSETILEALHHNHGKLMFSDKSDPEMVRAYFGMSKKSFKKAIGQLYKSQMIEIHQDYILLRDE